MFDAMGEMSAAQQVLFWMLVAVLWLLAVLVAVEVGVLVSERQKVRLQVDTLDAIRDLFRVMSRVNEYALKKITDVHEKTDEVRQVITEVVGKAADLSGLSIPAVNSKRGE